MKKRLVFFFILLAFANASAQTTKLQELRAQLRNHPQQDTFRVNRLTETAFQPDLTAAGKDSATDEALLLSKKLNYKEGEANALAAQSLIKDNVQAFNLLKQALAVAQKTGNKSLISKVSSILGVRLASTEQQDLALHYLLNAVALARDANDKSQLAVAQENLSEYYIIFNHDVVKSLDWVLQSLHTAEQTRDTNVLVNTWSQMASVYSALGDNATALTFFQKALTANEKIGNTYMQAVLLNNRGELYRVSGNYSEALKNYEGAISIRDDAYTTELIEGNEADAYCKMGDYPTAKKYAFDALNYNKKNSRLELVSWEYSILGNISLHMAKPDSALYYGKLGYDAAIKINNLEFKRDNAQVLADAYAQKKQFDKAYTYQNLYVSYRDSMMNNDVKNQIILLKYNADLQKKQAEITALNKDKQLQKAEAQKQYYLLIGTLAALLLIGALVLVLYRSNLHKQKANTLLQKQKAEIQNQRDQTNVALAELKSAQAQLVQSEKMASLGELTAGIAHEIQNPLNFVNNFSEVNTELIRELEEEAAKANYEEVKAIAKDIKENEQKIIHHGKRAESIVKGMLQHSRASTGKKEMTDINALIDESLRLSYHGMRAKDKEFSAEIKPEFDRNVGNVNVVPQDISRVLMNLFNNAFYTIAEKKRRLNGIYEPAVVVGTKKLDGKIEIHITDNGNGIPQNIIDKIFQPFFTTKPAGQGTGLGLSLSYDIIKAHGGKIKVETKEGEGSEFTIQLPVA